MDCFERCELADTIFAGSVTDPGDIAGHPAPEKPAESEKKFRKIVWGKHEWLEPVPNDDGIPAETLLPEEMTIVEKN